MSKRYVYKVEQLPIEIEQELARRTFPTKKDTAEGSRFYIYFPEFTTWRVARDPDDPWWKTVLQTLRKVEA